MAEEDFRRAELAAGSNQIRTQDNMALASNLELNQITATLEGQGVNEQELQKLINSGALEQLQQQGTNEQDLQALITSGAIEQINASNIAALDQIKKSGQMDQKLQTLVDAGAFERLTAENQNQYNMLLESNASAETIAELQVKVKLKLSTKRWQQTLKLLKMQTSVLRQLLNYK